MALGGSAFIAPIARKMLRDHLGLVLTRHEGNVAIIDKNKRERFTIQSEADMPAAAEWVAKRLVHQVKQNAAEVYKWLRHNSQE